MWAVSFRSGEVKWPKNLMNKAHKDQSDLSAPCLRHLLPEEVGDITVHAPVSISFLKAVKMVHQARKVVNKTKCALETRLSLLSL